MRQSRRPPPYLSVQLLPGGWWPPALKIHFNRVVEQVNILTGWTFFGWVISFVWALAEDKEAK